MTEFQSSFSLIGCTAISDSGSFLYSLFLLRNKKDSFLVFHVYVARYH
jgi:hypothetical protein